VPGAPAAAACRGAGSPRTPGRPASSWPSCSAGSLQGPLHGRGHFLLLLFLWSSHEPLRWCAPAVERACGLQVMKAPAGRRLRHLNMSIELRPLAPHTEPGLETCPRAGAVERESDLKLLEAAPGGGGGTLSRGKVLVPKALDADDNEDAESDSSDDDDEARAAPRAGHARRGCLCCGREAAEPASVGEGRGAEAARTMPCIGTRKTRRRRCWRS